MEQTDAITAEDELRPDEAPADGAVHEPAEETAQEPAKSSELVETLKTIGIVGGIFLVFRVLLFQPFTIPSASMEPNLYQGDYIVVSKFSYGISRHSIPFSPPLFHGRLFGSQPHRGDIVVFKLPRNDHTDYIKRLIGLPGDHIRLRDGVVYLNGKPLPRQLTGTVTEPTPFGFDHQVQRYRETLPGGRVYMTNDFGPDGDVDTTGEFVVPPKHYFMMGDNRDNSQDSRYPEAIGVGYVPEENLVGKAQIVLLSWNAKASLFKPWTWVMDLRPSRFFHILK